MLNDLLIWVVLLVGLVFLAVDKRRKIGALTLAYFLTLSLGHVPGVLAYLNVDSSWRFEPTKIGFDTTLIGMTAFFLGAGVARLLRQRTRNVEAHRQTVSGISFTRVGWRMLMMGVGSYFLVVPVAVLLPSFTAIASVTGLLLILGFWLRLYVADGWQTLLNLAATSILLPLSTLATGGFIGFGTVWALGIAAFCFVIARRRIWYYLATPVVIFLGLSLFVTYFQQRDDIRTMVWDQNSTLIDRVNRISTLVTDFEFLDLSNELHQLALDERLNQNFLVGIGVMRHRDYGTELLYGATVPIWVLVPRAIWPDKPSVGGGGELVSKFTGITFSEGTSVGAGQVLEFYMNFGMPGVVVGFAVFGFLLMRLDQRIMRALAMGRIGHTMRAALPGLALIAPLGNLVEILVAAASAVIVSRLIIYFNLLGSLPSQKLSAKMAGQTMPAIARR